MKKILEIYDKQINDLEKSIQSNYDFIKCPGCSITSSGWDMVTDMRFKCRYLIEEFTKLKEYKQCNCSKYRKLFMSFKKPYTFRYNIPIFHCETCDGYFSR